MRRRAPGYDPAVERAAVLLVAALAGGCGGETVEVPVTLALDAESCTTDIPDYIELTCPTAVGVALWGADSAERLQESCVDLPGTDRTLTALPPLLADVQLSTTADEPVRLEIGLFAPRSAGDGCPEVAARPADLLLYGETEPTDLATTLRGISVQMVCVDVSVGEWEACAGACDDGYNACIETGYCMQALAECNAACRDGDEQCAADCQGRLDECVADECRAARAECTAECPAATDCDTRCDDEYALCMEWGACDGRYETCLLDCDEAPPSSCAAVY